MTRKEEIEEQDKEEIWYECPECNDNRVWKDAHIEGYFTVRDKLSGEKYPQELCPGHGEIFVYGRRKGKIIGIDLKKMDLNNDFKCPLCGHEDMEFYPDAMGEKDIGNFICNYCKCFIHIKVDRWDNYKITHAYYQEDLQTKEFNESIEEILEILKTEGTPIKGEE